MISSKNKTLIMTLSVWIISVLTVVYVFSWIPFLLAIAYGWILAGLSFQGGMHYYYSHNAYKLKHKWMEPFMIVFVTLNGAGAIIPWSIFHRMHHKYSDLEGDPHSPVLYLKDKTGKDKFISILKLLFFYYDQSKIEPSAAKGFAKNKLLKWQQKYYFHLHLGYVLILAIINPVLVGYLWAIPIAYVYLQLIGVTWIIHSDTVAKYTGGYRTFDIPDRSWNLPIMAYLLPGAAYHNNHHKYAGAANNDYKEHEIDLVFWFIKLIGKDIKEVREK